MRWRLRPRKITDYAAVVVWALGFVASTDYMAKGIVCAMRGIPGACDCEEAENIPFREFAASRIPARLFPMRLLLAYVPSYKHGSHSRHDVQQI